MREITFFGNTNMGMIRTNNEDAFVVQNIWDEDHILAVAIDGAWRRGSGNPGSCKAASCVSIQPAA